MNVLEKILEELELAAFQEDAPLYIGNMAVDGYVRKSVAEEIIRSHMLDSKDANNKRLIDADALDEAVQHSFFSTTVNSKKLRALQKRGQFFRRLIAEQPTVYIEDRWIPVSERLPEDGTYLCTLDGELCGIDEPFTGMCGIENGKWDDEGCVIAWRPLPEPYHPMEG